MIFIPESYVPRLGVKETERAIKLIRDTFEQKLCGALHLERVSAPLFVQCDSGLNDNLNGKERPVRFDIPCIGTDVEIVHSLAKWKRMALGEYGFAQGEGLYTNMNAIRRDEETDNIHSIYVDQWDWELVMDPRERTLAFLQEIVLKIFGAMKETQAQVLPQFGLPPAFPEEITFLTSQELLDLFPNLPAKERENRICRDKKAVFLMQIGGELSNGEKHDGRAPDYDDWNLNGDLLVYNRVLDSAFELSSMGIRVNRQSLLNQLALAESLDRQSLPFHKALSSGELPQTIGGGIGQSRLCMFLLGKAHIGEVQASVWPQETISACKKANIQLL